MLSQTLYQTNMVQMARKLLLLIVAITVLLVLYVLDYSVPRSRSRITETTQWNNFNKSSVSDLVEKCVHGTNISRGAPSQMLQEAKANAEYMFQEFRKVIPEESLDGYGSHCWRESYSVQWGNFKYSGHIGNYSFYGTIRDMEIGNNQMMSLLMNDSHHKYETDLVCLPKVFMIGYFKCGSTFVYHLIHKIISLSLSESLKSSPLNLTSLKKEPIFWVTPYSRGSILNYSIPTASSLGRYLLYFIPGMRQISQNHRKEVILIDGKISKIFRWPQFKSKHFKATNYCLLAAVMPVLFPNSKFMVIMKNPPNFLYSIFWFYCSLDKDIIPMDLQLKGPDLFHERTVTKLKVFNYCMRDKTVPSISQPCELSSGHNYSSCILQRIHLLDSCTQMINYYSHSRKDPLKCANIHLTEALYFVHIRKWLTILPRERIHFMFLEDWIANLTGSAHNVLHFLGLDTSITAKPELIKEAADSCRHNQQTKVDYKNNLNLQMRQDTRDLLEIFFKPFNKLLAKLTGEKISWL